MLLVFYYQGYSLCLNVFLGTCVVYMMNHYLTWSFSFHPLLVLFYRCSEGLCCIQCNREQGYNCRFISFINGGGTDYCSLWMCLCSSNGNQGFDMDATSTWIFWGTGIHYCIRALWSIMASNIVEWCFADFACSFQGMLYIELCYTILNAQHIYLELMLWYAFDD